MIDVETLAVAVISGLGGGLLGTWLQIRHERHEAFRVRLTTAADDFVSDLQDAFMGLRDAEEIARRNRTREDDGLLSVRDPDSGERFAEVEEALERANDRIDQVHRRYPRVMLLFGSHSRSESAALASILNLREALGALYRFPVPNFKLYLSAHEAAHNTHIEFSEAASQEIRGEPWYTRVKRRFRSIYSPAYYSPKDRAEADEN